MFGQANPAQTKYALQILWLLRSYHNHPSHPSYRYKQKKTSPFGTRLFIKSGDDLLSHNVAGKRVKRQACLRVLQRAGAT